MEWTTENIPKFVLGPFFFPDLELCYPGSLAVFPIHFLRTSKLLLGFPSNPACPWNPQTFLRPYRKDIWTKKTPKSQYRSSLECDFQFCSFFFFFFPSFPSLFFKQENAIANKSISLTSITVTLPGSSSCSLVLVFHIKILLNLKCWKSTFTWELWHSMKLNPRSRTYIHCIKPAFMGCAALSTAFKWPNRSLWLHQLWKSYPKPCYSEGKTTFWKTMSSIFPFPLLPLCLFQLYKANVLLLEIERKLWKTPTLFFSTLSRHRPNWI